MKQVIVIIILFLSSVTAFAQERKDVTQEIKSLKGFATINIDSQVTPEGKIKKQQFSNHHLYKDVVEIRYIDNHTRFIWNPAIYLIH